MLSIYKLLVLHNASILVKVLHSCWTWPGKCYSQLLLLLFAEFYRKKHRMGSAWLQSDYRQTCGSSNYTNSWNCWMFQLHAVQSGLHSESHTKNCFYVKILYRCSVAFSSVREKMDQKQGRQWITENIEEIICCSVTASCPTHALNNRLTLKI